MPANTRSAIMRALTSAAKLGVKTALWLARHVWKKYFNVETPLYKIWWREHSAYMQRRLDASHRPYVTF